MVLTFSSLLVPLFLQYCHSLLFPSETHKAIVMLRHLYLRLFCCLMKSLSSGKNKNIEKPIQQPQQALILHYSASVIEYGAVTLSGGIGYGLSTALVLARACFIICVDVWNNIRQSLCPDITHFPPHTPWGGWVFVYILHCRQSKPISQNTPTHF